MAPDGLRELTEKCTSLPVRPSPEVKRIMYVSSTHEGENVAVVLTLTRFSDLFGTDDGRTSVSMFRSREHEPCEERSPGVEQSPAETSSVGEAGRGGNSQTESSAAEDHPTYAPKGV